MSLLKETQSLGSFCLQSSKDAIVFQDGKIIIVSDGCVRFTGFISQDILVFAEKVKEYEDYWKNLSLENKG